MRAVDVLATQRELYEGADAYLNSHGGVVNTKDPYSMSAALTLIICQNAEAYFVTSEMTEVMVAAAKSLPSQILTEGDWPSPTGLLVFEQALPARLVDELWKGPNQVIGFSWTNETKSGVLCIAPLVCLPDGRAAIVIGDDAEAPPPTWTAGKEPKHLRWPWLGPYVLATWTIMQQRLAVREVQPGQRAERRRCGRLGLPTSAVVVRVRQHEQANGEAEQHPVAWSHRWLVSGHWRNQFLPSRQMHRQQWISGYVKGPSDKPLVVKDRVTAWVR